MILTENTKFVMLEGHSMPPAITEALTYTHSLGMQPVLNKKGEATFKQRMAYEERELFQLQPTTMLDGSPGTALITLPGFATKIKELLADAYIKIEKHNSAKASAIKYDLEATCERLRPHQVPAAKAALENMGGVLQCPTGFGKTVLVSDMIRGYCTFHMERLGTPISIFISPTIDLCMKNWSALKERLPDRDVGVLCSSKTVWSEDVMVVTPDSVHHIDASKVGLVFFDEVHTVTYPRAAKALAFDKAIKFGLSATPEGRSDNADIVVEGVFGPIVYSRTNEEATQDGAILPVVICWVPMPHPNAKWHKYARPMTSQRHGMWRNDAYNKLIAQLALAVPDQYQTLALVDKLEHMNSIIHWAGNDRHRIAQTHASVKPDEKFMYIKPRKKADRKIVYDGFETGTIRKCIANKIYQTGVDFPNLALLIKGDGGSSPIGTVQGPGRTTRLGDGSKPCGVVVDFWPSWDRHYADDAAAIAGGPMVDGTLLRSAKKRHAIYKQQAYIEVNAPTPDIIFNALRGQYV